ncbi:hypothetical protein ACCO45_000720 [Purpureocillium lilacinum]|uniref:Uncharacterized protein n=1 Tax=Purpureocillium lilacinum TaxID=33203 RepID=A0ACC4E7U9_PURLI
MAAPNHTRGPGCRLAPVRHPTLDNDVPPTDAQFFYSSLIPIDDPLSTGSTASTSDSRSSKRQLRPFSNEDNIALEKAWLSLMSQSDRLRHQASISDRDSVRPAPDAAGAERDKLIQMLALDHWEKHPHTVSPQDASHALTRASFIPCCTELLMSVSEELQTSFCSLCRKHDPHLSVEEVARDVFSAIDALRKPGASDSPEQVLPTNSPLKNLGGKENEPLQRAYDESSDTKRRPRSTSQLTVTRATWFYRDTMLPIAPIVANQLETGYQELRPWTETWNDEIRCAIDVGPLGSPNRPFSNYHVIYKDERHAFLLKPSLKPSAYYGRKPLSKIMKGLTVGIPVIRGFDRHTWDRLHEKTRTTPGQPAVSAAEELQQEAGSSMCMACKAAKNGNQVNDLILVAHGIGQKFAERVESFHFTHAINGFRRAVNLELNNPLVQEVLRKDQSGLMILPLNWRTGLSFEDGGPVREEDEAARTADSFALKDIEPSTIPAVRSMMSDVMFDIPFYMSHHKGKMIKALVSEANRVYRLWCRNNPGFAEKGRVHLIAHSLGSAMALDVLSRQPTKAPSLTCLGLSQSPTSSMVGETGTFGCLAVDNIYNILAKEDPIAYLLNGAVDSAYASGLKIAYCPNALVMEAERPPTVRLPSQLELEVHDFSREEIAEKKFLLLNDNGQIDWFLKSGGGPLEIQYLNMLSAHTSYWTNQDFIRMLCIEIGRKPGRAFTVPAMRAVKAGKRFYPATQ